MEENHITGSDDYEYEWEPVDALACPYCRALVEVGDAEEECWACGKLSNLPDTK